MLYFTGIDFRVIIFFDISQFLILYFCYRFQFFGFLSQRTEKLRQQRNDKLLFLKKLSFKGIDIWMLFIIPIVSQFYLNIFICIETKSSETTMLKD